MIDKINNLLKKIVIISSVGAAFVILSACGNSEVNKSMNDTASQYAKQVINLGPGAQEACESAGGLPALTLELNGTKTPVCQFANGKRCAVDIIQSGSCI